MKGISAQFELRNLIGTHVLGVKGTDWNLVKRSENDDSWTPVDRLDRDVSSADLDAHYGIWIDGRMKREQQDGLIQNEEVHTFEDFRREQNSDPPSPYMGSTLFVMDSAEIKVGPQHTASLESEWTRYHYWHGYPSPLSPRDQEDQP